MLVRRVASRLLLLLSYTSTSFPGAKQRGKAPDFGFPKEQWRELHGQGRIEYHPVFPGKEGFGARRIETEDDVRDVIALMRLNYDRATSSHSSAA